MFAKCSAASLATFTNVSVFSCGLNVANESFIEITNSYLLLLVLFNAQRTSSATSAHPPGRRVKWRRPPRRGRRKRPPLRQDQNTDSVGISNGVPVFFQNVELRFEIPPYCTKFRRNSLKVSPTIKKICFIMSHLKKFRRTVGCLLAIHKTVTGISPVKSWRPQLLPTSQDASSPMLTLNGSLRCDQANNTICHVLALQRSHVLRPEPFSPLHEIDIQI